MKAKGIILLTIFILANVLSSVTSFLLGLWLILGQTSEVKATLFVMKTVGSGCLILSVLPLLSAVDLVIILHKTKRNRRSSVI